MHQRKKIAKNRTTGLKTEDDTASQNSTNISSSGTKIPWRRLIAQVLVCAGLLYSIYVIHLLQGRGSSEVMFASADEKIGTRKAVVDCVINDYDSEKSLFPDCIPKICGRVVADEVVLTSQVETLLRIVKSVLNLSRSDSCASIVDLHSGSLSYGQKFVNMYKLFDRIGKYPFTEEDLLIYSQVRERVRSMVSYSFNVDPSLLHLASPTFFSEMNADLPAKTIHDQYWHQHVDKETYGSFHYTCLLYLSRFERDFEGGRFIFLDGERNVTVEPKEGRVMCFTSGSENPHLVERVTKGIRNALTIAFTCDPRKGIQDPKIQSVKTSQRSDS